MAELIMEFRYIDSASRPVQQFQRQLNRLVDVLGSTDTRMSRLNRTSTIIRSTFTKMISVLKKVVSSIFSMTGAVIALAGGYGLARLGKSFIKAASTAEQYRVQLEISTRSTEKAALIFKSMSEYASKVPHTYEDIMGAATRLSRVLGGNVAKIKKWMPFIGDLAAAIGLGIEETTTQVTRMLSAGAASADRFRELGVLSMLGFTAGVSYSIEETRKIMWDSWTKTDSQFKGATEKLAKTWKGLMSMMYDKWFKLRTKIMDAGLFDIMKKGMEEFLEWSERILEGKNFEEMIKNMTDKIVKTVISAMKGMALLFDGIATMFTMIQTALIFIVKLIRKVPGFETKEVKLLKKLVKEQKDLTKELEHRKQKSFLAKIFTSPYEEEVLKQKIISTEKQIKIQEDLIRKSIEEYNKQIKAVNESTSVFTTFADSLNKWSVEADRWWEKQKTKKAIQVGLGPGYEIGRVPRLGGPEQFSALTGESLDILEIFKKTNNEIKLANELTLLNIQKIKALWIEMLNDLVIIIKSNLHDALMDSKTSFSAFAKDFRSIFTKQFINKVEIDLKKLGDKIIKDMMREMTPGEKRKWAEIGDLIGNAIGGAMAGYGIGEAIGGETGGTLGAVGGGIGSIWGPMGTMAGGALGGIIGGLFEDTKKAWKASVPPDIDILFKVIDGKLEESGDWKSTDIDIKSKIMEFIEEQLELFSVIAGIVGEEVENFTARFQAMFGETESVMSKGYSILSNVGEVIGVLGSDTEENIKEHLARIIGTVSPGSVSGVYGPTPGEGGAYELLDEESKQRIADMLKGGEQAGESYLELVEQLRTSYSLSKEEWTAKLEELGTIWEDMYAELEEIAKEMDERFGSSIGNAFNIFMKSGDFKSFSNNLKKGVFDNVKEGLKSAFQDKLYLKLMKPLFDNFDDIFDDIDSISNLTTEETENKIDEVTKDMEEAMDGLTKELDLMQPFLDKFYAAIEGMSDSMDIATEEMMTAQKEYVDSLLTNRELIDNWITDMTFSEQAPVQSLEMMQNQYQELLKTAQETGETEDIQKLLDFTQGTYLPFMESASFRSPGEDPDEMTGAYGDLFEKTMSEIEALAPTDEEITKEIKTLLDILEELGNQTELMDYYNKLLPKYKEDETTDASLIDKQSELIKGDFLKDIEMGTHVQPISEELMSDSLKDIEMGTHVQPISEELMSDSLKEIEMGTHVQPISEELMSDSLKEIPRMFAHPMENLSVKLEELPEKFAYSIKDLKLKSHEKQATIQIDPINSGIIGKEIAKELLMNLPDSDEEREIHIHLEVDGQEIGQAVVTQINTHSNLRTIIREVVR